MTDRRRFRRDPCFGQEFLGGEIQQRCAPEGDNGVQHRASRVSEERCPTERAATAFSSVSIVANSLRLYRFNPN